MPPSRYCNSEFRIQNAESEFSMVRAARRAHCAMIRTQKCRKADSAFLHSELDSIAPHRPGERLLLAIRRDPRRERLDLALLQRDAVLDALDGLLDRAPR